jgi:hypothetical protein
MTTILWAIMKKEILAAIRASKLQVVISVGFPLVAQWAIMQHMAKAAGTGAEQNEQMSGMINMGPTILLLYVAPMLIPFLANSLLTKSFTQEKASGALMPIVATGINVGFLWAAKMLAIFVYCYVISLFILELDVLLLTLYFKLTLTFSFTTAVLVLVISPVVATAITAIMSFMFWTVKFGNILGTFLPMIVTMGLVVFANTRPTTMVMLKGITVVMLAAGAIVFFCGYIISKMSKSRILGL